MPVERNEALLRRLEYGAGGNFRIVRVFVCECEVRMHEWIFHLNDPVVFFTIRIGQNCDQFCKKKNMYV